MQFLTISTPFLGYSVGFDLNSKIVSSFEVFSHHGVLQFCVNVQVRWEFQKWNGSYQPFTAEQNTKLEKAYINKEEGTECNFTEANGKVVTWKVDFKTMQITNSNNTKEIQRKPLHEGKDKIIHKIHMVLENTTLSKD